MEASLCVCVCVCVCEFANFFVTVGRIVLIFVGNIHLTPGQHINYIVCGVYLSVCRQCRRTLPRLSDFFNILCDCWSHCLNIWWKYPSYAWTTYKLYFVMSICLSVGEHFLDCRISLYIYGRNFHLMPRQHIYARTKYLYY